MVRTSAVAERAGGSLVGVPVRAPSRQLTTVDGPTTTTPAGSVAVTVSSSLVQVAPITRDNCPRTAATSEPGTGARSCGNRETASPRVRTFPVSASRNVCGDTETDASRPVSGSRNVCGDTETDASRDPDTVTVRAAVTSAGETTTSPPSATPRFDMVTSSVNTTPGVASSAAGAAKAALRRAPVRCTASQARRPSASSTSGCSRTTPRRASSADGVCRTVRVICGSLTLLTLMNRWAVMRERADRSYCVADQSRIAATNASGASDST
ncbi:hypothetical protein A4R44_02775 [Amycolatopsis sp. M39]|nr:hypothetical protein A4R44_02775 [Amycolatopsis sp. M39]